MAHGTNVVRCDRQRSLIGCQVFVAATHRAYLLPWRAEEFASNSFRWRRGYAEFREECNVSPEDIYSTYPTWMGQERANRTFK